MAVLWQHCNSLNNVYKSKAMDCVMFTPIRNNVFRWETPWPEGNVMLVGHQILKDTACILIDPPHVPGLIEALRRIGGQVAIILTTQNHTRGSKYIAFETGAKIYVPEQNPEAIEPGELVAVKVLSEFEKYSAGKVLGMKIFKDFEDFALLTEEKDLIVSDNARGTVDGKLALWPECNPHDPPYPPNEKVHREFKKLIQETGAVSLLAGHGYDIVGNLQELEKSL